MGRDSGPDPTPAQAAVLRRAEGCDSAAQLDRAWEIASGEITRRCWWESGVTEGRIPRDWNVHAYPRIDILVHKGVIWLKITGQLADSGASDRLPPFSPIIEDLLKECERDRRPGP